MTAFAPASKNAPFQTCHSFLAKQPPIPGVASGKSHEIGAQRQVSDLVDLQQPVIVLRWRTT